MIVCNYYITIFNNLADILNPGSKILYNISDTWKNWDRGQRCTYFKPNVLVQYFCHRMTEQLGTVSSNLPSHYKAEKREREKKNCWNNFIKDVPRAVLEGRCISYPLAVYETGSLEALWPSVSGTPGSPLIFFSPYSILFSTFFSVARRLCALKKLPQSSSRLLEVERYQVTLFSLFFFLIVTQQCSVWMWIRICRIFFYVSYSSR